jgi:hypothetical protein
LRAVYGTKSDIFKGALLKGSCSSFKRILFIVTISQILPDVGRSTGSLMRVQYNVQMNSSGASLPRISSISASYCEYYGIRAINLSSSDMFIAILLIFNFLKAKLRYSGLKERSSLTTDLQKCGIPERFV